MDGADNVGVLVVNRLPLELFLVEVKDDADIVKCFIGSLVFDFGFTLGAKHLARQVSLVIFVVHRVNGAIWLVLGGVLASLLSGQKYLLLRRQTCEVELEIIDC